jgi:hypothetical protein
MNATRKELLQLANEQSALQRNIIEAGLESHELLHKRIDLLTSALEAMIEHITTKWCDNREDLEELQATLRKSKTICRPDIKNRHVLEQVEAGIADVKRMIEAMPD